MPNSRLRARGVVQVISEDDHRIKLHIHDTEYEAWFQYHEASDRHDVEAIVLSARSRGWVEDADPEAYYDMRHYMGDGIWRVYLQTADTRYDENNGRPGDDDMPDLSQTAYGPHSGFMEAV